ncbi:aromatic amino acid DMT transporter YddG [Acinetobacter nectaris]|uniref:aromatic amino acid DMT transporter YddG n=1 Tax=Acinetobacter nectaris TaxID=1219382 RepID=UPI001EFFB902|nr:aromatic amino acid DMT transporter YddG [Acinetobacter nectaris]MCF8998130.1 aromatic amino acid DMT transporter YddG [Acinetobacter nectaris]MCF9026944.1 aromatic amino acid DMT transporter YddG [Acinetobacter nectaris]
MSKNKATLLGLSAVVLWSLIVALIKEISGFYGVILGAALIYSLASIFLILTLGFPKIKEFPTKYLVLGSILFVAYELCLSLSIGYSTTNRQAIEVSIVNYLWPTFTILFSILFNHQKANFLVVPGFILALFGICLVLAGDQGISIEGILSNIRINPLSYGLAFIGTLIWATYCTLTTKISDGKNGITLFFILVSFVLWMKFLFLTGNAHITFELKPLIYLVMAGFAMGMGYGAWNIGILRGNVTLLATASYFVPVLSAVVSAILLNTSLTLSFWKGTLLVCLGALLCWLSTKKIRRI